MDPLNETTLSTEQAWEAHSQPLLHFLHGLTRDRELAEDLVQETFLRLAREELAGRSPQHTRGWLYRVAANLLASHGRRTQVARRELSRLAIGETSRASASAEEQVSARDALRAVVTGASALTRTERRTLALAVREYSNAEMARALGISEAAARTRLCRARAHLATTLAA